MVRNVAKCLMWIVLASVVGCRDSKTGSETTGPGTGGGSFVYLQLIDGTRGIRWMSPDGKQVMFFRTDMRWVCEKAGDEIKCGPPEALAPRAPGPEPRLEVHGLGSGAQLESCPCTEKPCLPMCLNPSVLPGLLDPKGGGVPSKP